MLSIQKSKSHKGNCTPNVLPCRINHSGPVNASSRYWEPRTGADGKTVAYFRGRKLHGRKLKVPGGYRGVVVSKTEKVLPKAPVDEDDEEEPEEDVRVLEEKAGFGEVVVWGHEVVADGTDAYVRGVEEWVGFAGLIHGLDGGDEGKDGEGK